MKNLNDVLNEITTEILSEAPGLIQRGGGAIPAPSFAGNPGIASRPVGDKKDLDSLRFQRALGSLKSSVPQTTRLLRDVVKNGEIAKQRNAILNPNQTQLPDRKLISQDELNARQLQAVNQKVADAASNVSHQAREKQAADEEAQLHALHQSHENDPGFTGATQTLSQDLSDTATTYGKAKLNFLAKKETNTQAPMGGDVSSTQTGTPAAQPQTSETPNAPTPTPASANTGAFGDYLDNAKRSVLELGDKFTKGATNAGNYLGQKASELGDWISKNPEWAAGGLGAALAAGAGALYLRKKMRERQRNSAGY